MDCCAWTQRLDEIYDEATARADLAEYHRAGPRPTTRFLIRAILEAAPAQATLLDVGGGAGVIQHELARGGFRHIAAVDASSHYLRVAQEEATRLGYSDRAKYTHGDFATLAHTLPRASAVTLDRVLCCYPHFDAILDAAAQRADTLIGLVYPRDQWWVRGMKRLEDAYRRLVGDADRAWIHPVRRVHERLAAHGFRPTRRRLRFYWRTEIFQRSPTPT